jgi:hypothetical protein
MLSTIFWLGKFELEALFFKVMGVDTHGKP